MLKEQGFCQTHTTTKLVDGKCCRCERKVRAILDGVCPNHKNVKLVEGPCLLCNKSREKSKIKALESGNCPTHTKIKLADGKCQAHEEEYRRRKDAAERNNTCSRHINLQLIEGECEICKEEYRRRKIIADVGGTCPKHLDALLIDGCCIFCIEGRAKLRSEAINDERCLAHRKVKLVEGKCPTCRDEYQKSKEKSQATGMCRKHPEIEAISGMQCYDCWYAAIALNALGSEKYKDMIKESFKNNFCCFTGSGLFPGNDTFSATMDHSIPVSRGGKKKMENCQWVTRQVNFSKSNRTTEEYLEEIRQIYIYTKSLKSPQPISPQPISEISHKFKQSNGFKCHQLGCMCLAEIGALCNSHYFKRISLKHFGSWKYAEQVETLFKNQGGICSYTGAKLILCGKDITTAASIDHKIPTTRGGPKEISNMQYVSQRVNVIKQNMTHKEFLKFCENVVIRFNLDVPK